MKKNTDPHRPMHPLWRTLAGGLLSLLLWLTVSPLMAQTAVRNFDHLKTGFALTGVHSSQRCESCHVNGIFKGTPRECASCHSSGARLAAQNVVKPQQHIPTQLPCDSCHGTVTFSGAKFNHMGIAPTACASCHNGLTATGKPAGHVMTTASCGTCHRTTAWLPVAKPDHSGFTAATVCSSCHNGTSATGKPAGHIATTGNCIDCHQTTAWLPAAKPDHSSFTTATNCTSCHNGTSATGKPANHMPTTLNCVACHSATGAAFTPNLWKHTQQPVTNQCATCHTGTYLTGLGKPSNHVPYQTLTGVTVGNCDSCHKSGFTTWVPGQFHANVAVTSQCATCHLSGVYGQTSKPATAIHATVTGNCENCHKTTSSWIPSKPDHSIFTAATNCTSCHNGTSATGKPANHMPTTLNCVACHSATGAAFTPNLWKHTQQPVTNQCATCHTGTYLTGLGKPSNHIPYQTLTGVAVGNCDSCHKSGFTTWVPGQFHANVAVTSQCASCHLSGVYGQTSKPATAIHATVTGNCESCHKTTSSWIPSKPDHSLYTVATNCTTCHNGTSATGKPTNHMPTTLNCIACHSATGAAFTPNLWKHTQQPVTNQCATCHTGSYLTGLGKPSNHIPYQTLTGVAISNCDSCHKSGFTSWIPGQFHANVAVTSQCASCHLSGVYGQTSKPVTAIHATVTGNCESCHKTTSSWIASKPDHSLYTAATNCTSCHNGTSATGKPANHMPTTLNCIACHSATGAAFTPNLWKHTQQPVTNQCATCHTGSYLTGLGKPSNHIPYQTLTGVAISNCDSCHKSGFTSWLPSQFHSNVAVTSQCATCHLSGVYGQTSKPATITHATVTGYCEGCHRSTSSWLAVQFTHTAANAVGTGTCDTCHNGTTALGKPANHIPIPAGIAKCDSCHKSQVSFATSVTMNHSVVTTGTCKSCHNGSYLSAGVQGALAKPANHIPEASQLLNGATMDCKACHTNTVSWTAMTMNHNGSMGSGAGWCKGCHNTGTSYLGNMTTFSLNHRGGSSIKVDCSQSGCHRPLGSIGSTYSKWN